MKRSRSIGAWLLVVFWTSATLLAEDVAGESRANWPQWRGPMLNGVAPMGDPPVRWTATENLRWKTLIDGRGHSTPIVWGDRIFLVTAIPIDKAVPQPYVIPVDTPRIGKHNAVMCSEAAPFYASNDIDHNALEASYIGIVQLEAIETMCSLWPAGPVDDDFREPLDTAIPVLLLSGDADPITPPR